MVRSVVVRMRSPAGVFSVSGRFRVAIPGAHCCGAASAAGLVCCRNASGIASRAAAAVLLLRSLPPLGMVAPCGVVFAPFRRIKQLSAVYFARDPSSPYLGRFARRFSGRSPAGCNGSIFIYAFVAAYRLHLGGYTSLSYILCLKAFQVPIWSKYAVKIGAHCCKASGMISDTPKKPPE